MARKRLVVEMGRGTDLQGRDYTKAAVRALKDALHRNSLTVVPALGYPREAMEVEIVVGVARPGEVDREAVAAAVPYGRASVEVVRGGLDVPADEGDGVTVIANAAAVVWLDMDGVEASAGASAERGGPGEREAGSGRDHRDARSGRDDPDERGGRENDTTGTKARRIILESGTGADLHGEDVTRAACRAVRDALYHSSLPLFLSLGIEPSTMEVEVRLGVQRPEDVDAATVAAEIPYGRVVVAAEPGGLDVVDAERGTRIVIATAAVIARLPLPEGRFRSG